MVSGPVECCRPANSPIFGNSSYEANDARQNLDVKLFDEPRNVLHKHADKTRCKVSWSNDLMQWDEQRVTSGLYATYLKMLVHDEAPSEVTMIKVNYTSILLPVHPLSVRQNYDTE
jgi:hypothetical protein